MTVRDIIKACGGAPRIAEESKRLHALDPTTYRVAGLKAVYNWPNSGIPEWHWFVVMRLSGLAEKDIFKANREREKEKATQRPDQTRRKRVVRRRMSVAA